MQLLFSESEEFGNHKGLNLIEGSVIRFTQNSKSGLKLKVPQIQWNKIYRSDFCWDNTLMRDVNDGSYMYFVHSYYVVPEKKENILSLTEYDQLEYASGVINKNVIGVQFHPEKSAKTGFSLYQNWLK
jgi:glutamine amidotransferase